MAMGLSGNSCIICVHYHRTGAHFLLLHIWLIQATSYWGPFKCYVTPFFWNFYIHLYTFVIFFSGNLPPPPVTPFSYVTLEWPLTCIGGALSLQTLSLSINLNHNLPSCDLFTVVAWKRHVIKILRNTMHTSQN